MFTTEDLTQLSQELNRFNLPMFVAQLRPEDGEFEFLALNDAYETQSGIKLPQATCRKLDTVLPADQAAEMGTKYARCLSQGTPLRYREMLQMPRGPMIWDTTLHPTKTASGGDRVVGIAILVERIKRNQHDTLAFEDVRFFATTSAHKLAQISTLLEAVEQGAVEPDKLLGSVGMLAGMCRAIDLTMQELRGIAENRLYDDINPTIHLLNGTASTTEFPDEVEATLETLIGLATDLPKSSALPLQDQPEWLRVRRA